jgi:predicted nucleic acid-binding protein
MIYLLSTQSLLDLLTGKANMEAWKKSTAAQTIELSTVSIGQALNEINKLGNATTRTQLTDALERLILSLKSYQGVVPFDENASRIWVSLMGISLLHREGKPKVEVSSESRMVVATALARGAIYVDAKRPYHANISNLRVLSP